VRDDDPPALAPVRHAGLLGRRWGDGERTIVLVHGLGVASRMVTPLARELAGSDATILAPDLPGFGASAELPAASITEQGATVAAAIRRWGPPVALLGCSFGTQVALAAAEELGADLDALVLVSPTIDPAHRSLGALAARWPLELATQPSALRRIQRQDHATAGLSRVLGTLLASLEDRPEDRARGITAPTLVVRGTRDPLVTTGWAKHLAALLPAGRVVVLPGRHAMTFTEPQSLATTVDRFLGSEMPTAAERAPRHHEVTT
jgi:2-hydroxy-6-oxonona-2,4-dienedioate hydrolase